jgi:hypothetical protein
MGPLSRAALINAAPVSRLLLGALGWFGAELMAVGEEARDRAVEMRAIIRQAPPRITLQWNPPVAAPLLSQRVFRRRNGTGVWTEAATLPRTARTYADNAVSVGVAYEYFVYRLYDGLPGTASGWLRAGIRAPLVAERGRVILLVDDTMAGPLAAELAQFTSDLIGDGWIVARQDVARTAAVPDVRATVQSLYAADPAKPKALILFGRIPVPYSGDFAPDGHIDHRGAWPADVNYADIDGVWTDSTVNSTGASVERNRNVPGDGKFDQSALPSDVELEIGRIDLSTMPVFGRSETELLRQYLGRDHQFRHRLGAFAAIPRRALIDDNFGFFSGEAFATTGWRSFTALFGSANVRALDWLSTLQTQKYLCAYGCGPGGYNGANGVSITNEFADKNSQAVFNFLFGSYFGDWDLQDNFLRAPLSGTAASLGLTSAWAGRPHWFLHPLGLGETIGFCTRLTQNNLASFPAGYEANNTERGVHIALMGDPTLRLHPVKPPTNLVARAGANQIALSWRASGEGPLEGYLISRANSPLGRVVRLRGALVPGLSFVDRSATPGVSYTYLVRAVKRETTSSGSYLNPSQGAFSQPAAATRGAGPEINVVGNNQAVTDGDTAPLAATGTDFGAVEVGQPAAVHTFTIRNPGPATLTISRSVLSGANAADFVVTNMPVSVAAGGEATFDVSFLPVATGSRVAKLSLRNNDGNEVLFDFALGGTGVAAHATLDVTPALLELSVRAGSTLASALQISNAGPGPLAFTAASSLDAYNARDSDSFAGPTYDWIDISTTGTEITNWPNLDDSATGEIPLGFTFPFYGTAFDILRVCTNGFIAPRDSITFGQNGPLPNSSAPASMIAPFWADLAIDDNSHVFWQNLGGKFVVQYENVKMLSGPNSRITCEAILASTGEVTFQYKMLTEVADNYTVGIQNGRCDDAVLVAYNRGYLHPGLAVRFAPPQSGAWLEAPTGTQNVPPGVPLQVPISVNATALTPGEYYAELMIRSNAATDSTAVIPVKVTVTP